MNWFSRVSRSELLINSSGKIPYNRKGGGRGILEWKTQGMKNNGIDISYS